MTSSRFTPGNQFAYRSVAGQSLDEAREEFRFAWQAKVARKRRSLIRARRWIAALNRATEVAVVAGSVLGSIAGIAFGLIAGYLVMLFAMALAGAMIGGGAAMLLASLLQLPAWGLRWYVYRTEVSIENGEPL